MSITNRERVGRGLDILHQGLYPFVEREMRVIYQDSWLAAAAPFVSEDRTLRRTVAQILQQDIGDVLKVMWHKWYDVFKQTLGNAEKNLVGELMTIRNGWAHNQTFSTDDTYRALDTISRLLSAVSAPQAEEIEKQKQELLRIRFDEQARSESRKVAARPLEINTMGGLKPWREVVTPHPDVASGRYQQAEFAADLWQVYQDEGADEYRLPTEFFRRTYITEGLKQLLTNALCRLSGQSADPVIELQTNFGGGKTHALLSLYHMCLGCSTEELPILKPILEQAGTSELPKNVNTAIIAGNKIPPGEPDRQKDGTLVRTLWGQIAWQLGGREGYEMVREADETSTNPGDKLKDLFNRYAPCLILIDEWVAYARQLHDNPDLPGGTFDTHFTFAQTLSESAKNADRTLLVVSIPASEVEMGGERGKEATKRLKNAISRVESPWRPANAEESFEIVRRRLFQPITDPNLFVARDAVVQAFSDMYRTQPQEFPSECRQAEYERRMQQAYPIHPELFDRLYSDWSSIDTFQRTRGVLRLMSKVIHFLWEQSDRSLMLLPCNIPMADSQVQSELTRYLEDSWVPIIEKDVDGVNSLPVFLDGQNPNLGRYSACRRVTRTIYLGSAPNLRAANLGIEDRRIKLGCVQPGETTATFGDALRRLSDQAIYLYVGDGNRYWISTKPNVTRTAQDLAQEIKQDHNRVWEEIIRRLRTDQHRGEFAGIHIAPNSSADIPDEPTMGVRLIVLSPQYTHSNKVKDSSGYQQIQEILAHKGNGPRYCNNLLLFLLADQSKLDTLTEYVCEFLAWDSILRSKDDLNLDVFQKKQAQQKRDSNDQKLNILVKETYEWLIFPNQPDSRQSITWQEIRIQGQESPIIQASNKLVHEEYLICNYSAQNLRLEILEPYIWPNKNHIDTKTLWQHITNYPYLARMKNEQVLLRAIEQGVATPLLTENFAYATGYDETQQRYLGLKTCQGIKATISSQTLIVKPDIAAQQLQAERTPETKKENTTNHKTSIDGVMTNTVTIRKDYNTKSDPTPPPEKKLRRFHGSVDLDPLRVIRDAESVTNEVIQHLASLVGSQVQITLEVQVQLPEGVPDHIIRTVTENCRTLKFKTHNFEQE